MPDENGDRVLLLDKGQPAPLGGDCDLSLELTQWFQVVPAKGERGPLKCRTSGWHYSLRSTSTDRERITYHWHPRSHRKQPHVHVNATDITGRHLNRDHLLTGRVAIEHLLIVAHELGAEPLKNDWRRVLNDSLDRFEKWRTWA